MDGGTMERSMDGGTMTSVNRGVVLAELDPFRASREEAALEKFRDKDGWGPRRPKKKAGDAWIIIGALLGIAGGAIGGFLINPAIGVLGIIGGGVIGALAGSGIASLARGRRKTRLLRHRSGERRYG